MLAHRMRLVIGLDNLHVVLKFGLADTLLVNEDRCRSITDASFNFAHNREALDRLIRLCDRLVIAFREHIKVHLVLDPLAVEDSTRPRSYNLLVVAHVLLCGSC